VLGTKRSLRDSKASLRPNASGLARCAERSTRAPREPQEDPMRSQIVMDTSGDTRHQFDPDDAAAVAPRLRGGSVN
jgi:hypothetical protein